MTDFLMDDRYGSRSEDVECVAYNEADLHTCPCASCGSWRRSQEANAVYQRKYDQQMEAVRAAAKRPLYRDWKVPR